MKNPKEIAFELPTVKTPPEWARLLDLESRRGIALNSFIVLFFLYHLAYPLDLWTKTIRLGPDRFVILSVILSFTLVFLLVSAKRHSPRRTIPWYDFLLITATVVGCGCMFFNTDIMAEGTAITVPGLICGILTLLVLLEGVRRTMG